MYSFSPLSNSTQEMHREADLLKLAFGNETLMTFDYLKWLYTLNPDGNAVGFNAIAKNGELAAHYVTQPIKAILFGKETMGLLSLNTATHPAHRGKGLFTELAKKTYEYASSLGYQFVIGVANQHSTHGFVKHLGFKMQGPLEAMIGIASADYSDAVVKQDFARIWNRENLLWRLQNPAKRYELRKKNNFFGVYADSGKPFTNVLLGTFGNALLPSTYSSSSFHEKFISLFIGTKSAMKWKSKILFKIPVKFRPSPLNLIFKDLSGTGRVPDMEKLIFSAIDFDAY